MKWRAASGWTQIWVAVVLSAGSLLVAYLVPAGSTTQRFLYILAGVMVVFLVIAIVNHVRRPEPSYTLVTETGQRETWTLSEVERLTLDRFGRPEFAKLMRRQELKTWYLDNIYVQAVKASRVHRRLWVALWWCFRRLNGLHPQYADILDYLWSLAIKTSITSNGRSIAVLSDAAVKRFHSVEFSLDFPTEHEHDLARGPGNWRTVMESLERCTGLGVPTTVTAVMMNTNYRRMDDLAKVAAGLGANLRVNVYQPSKTDRFTLGYEQFWTGFKTLFGSARLVATSEPVLAAVLGIPGFAGPGCGHSTESALRIGDLETRGEAIVETREFADARRAPARCDGCPCLGGCAGRRALAGAPDEPDPYCPFARKDHVTIDWEAAGAADFPKLGSACTTVVSAC